MDKKHGPKSKGTGSKGKAKRGATRVKATAVSATTVPELIVALPLGEMVVTPASDENPVDDGVPVEVATTTEPTPRRKRDMTIEELQAEYLRVVGRTTQSRDRRYLMWRLSAGGLRRIPVGPIQKRVARDKVDMQVLPVGMLRNTVAKLDTAANEMGFKSRSALIRAAIVVFLRSNTTDAARAAADAIDAEARA